MKTFLASLLLALFSLNAMASIPLVQDGSEQLGKLIGYETSRVEMVQIRDAILDCVATTNEMAQEAGADVDQEAVLDECREANGL